MWRKQLGSLVGRTARVGLDQQRRGIAAAAADDARPIAWVFMGPPVRYTGCMHVPCAQCPGPLLHFHVGLRALLHSCRV